MKILPGLQKNIPRSQRKWEEAGGVGCSRCLTAATILWLCWDGTISWKIILITERK